MVVACRAALDNLNLWIETADTQLKKYRVIPDSCLEKLAEAAETLQKTLVLSSVLISSITNFRITLVAPCAYRNSCLISFQH